MRAICCRELSITAASRVDDEGACRSLVLARKPLPLTEEQRHISEDSEAAHNINFIRGKAPSPSY